MPTAPKGGYIADRQTARGNIVRLNKSFFDDNREVVFGTAEERIRTRLGDDRVEITFDPPSVSPFDASCEIHKLAVSANWLKGEDVPESVETSAVERGFEFSVGGSEIALRPDRTAESLDRRRQSGTDSGPEASSCRRDRHHTAFSVGSK